jgi:hypothetical protein
MAKPPPVQTFEINCEVEVHNFGPAMVALAHIEGLVVTGSKLVTTVRSFAKNATGFNTQAFVREWIKEHPTFKAKEVVQAIRATGNGNGLAAYPALKVLVEEGALKKIGEGMYSLPGVKALAAPKQAKQARHEVPHSAFILRVASRNHGKFNTTRMKAQFEKDGRNPGTVSPTIASMMTKKQIKRVGEGEYVLLNKAAPKKTDKTFKVKANGKASEAAAVETSPGA